MAVQCQSALNEGVGSARARADCWLGWYQLELLMQGGVLLLQFAHALLQVGDPIHHAIHALRLRAPLLLRSPGARGEGRRQRAAERAPHARLWAEGRRGPHPRRRRRAWNSVAVASVRWNRRESLCFDAPTRTAESTGAAGLGRKATARNHLAGVNLVENRSPCPLEGPRWRVQTPPAANGKRPTTLYSDIE